MPYIGVKPADEFTSKDLNGEQLILDADADTTITADTDDTIDIRIAGADDFQFTANSFNVLSGSTLTVDSGATITNSGTANNFGVALANDADNRVVTGTGSGGLNGEANLTFDGNALVVKGTSPSITIGDAGAEDTKIVFDGNAQDYYMGLDDTDDDLKIGLGSAVGTTAHMVFNEAGEITKPLQPAFLVQPTSTQSNIANDGSYVTIVLGTERFDAGGNFASNTFTAPVTGKYCLSASLYMAAMDSAATYMQIYLRTSNRDYVNLLHTAGFDVDGYNTMHITVLADMDAADTCTLVALQSEGTAQTDIGTTSWFSGWLVS